MKRLLFILVFIFIILFIFYKNSQIDYSNDPLNCGAKDNQCESGHKCVDAQCVLID